MQLEHATWFMTVLISALSLIIVGAIVTAKRGRKLAIRRIPGLAAIDDAVGRATEMGRPILFSLGLGSLSITTLQALAVLHHVARQAARYGTRIITPIREPTVFPVAEEVTREAYRAEGKLETFRPDDIRFLSTEQFAYAAGTVGIMNREHVASVFLFGDFYAEALILAESGHDIGAIQVAGTPQTTQIPFFIAACDYVVIGDEYYAASAYLTQEPTLLGSLIGQDIGKLLLLVLVLTGLGIATVLGAKLNTAEHNFLLRWLGG
jgi:hypothetical protein